MKKKSQLLILVLCTIFITSAGTYAGLQWFGSGVKNEGEIAEYLQPINNASVDLSKVDKTYQLIKEAYVEEIDSETLIEGAVEGMLSALNDPYSVYMNEEKASQFNSSLESSFEGIGAEVTEVDGKILIIAPFKNSPAEKAGLKPHDQILKVDGEDVTGLDVFEVTLKIRGEKGTTVSIEVARDGLREPLVIEVKRDEIPLETVFSSVLKEGDKNIGYIEITSFSRDTGKDFKSQLKELEEKNIAGLIIDVRGNPGGLLTSVEEIAGELVTNKKPMLQVENKEGERDEIISMQKEKRAYPIAVLTDKGSASASEILAAALKEVEGYPTIGETTFGKGTVQQQIELEDKSNIKLTMYKWLTPDGNWIHKEGIEPDVHVTQPELYHIHPLHVEETLTKDMNNEQVKTAQTILKSLGLEPGRIDGYYNETTETAVKLFQQQRDLPVTGRIDEKTAAALEEAVLEEQDRTENDRQLQMALKYFEHK